QPTAGDVVGADASGIKAGGSSAYGSGTSGKAPTQGGLTRRLLMSAPAPQLGRAGESSGVRVSHAAASNPGSGSSAGFSSSAGSSSLTGPDSSMSPSAAGGSSAMSDVGGSDSSPSSDARGSHMAVSNAAGSGSDAVGADTSGTEAVGSDAYRSDASGSGTNGSCACGPGSGLSANSSGSGSSCACGSGSGASGLGKEERSMMASSYEIGRFIGKGSFSTVHLARDIRTRRHCAVKLIDVSACEERAAAARGRNAIGLRGQPLISDLLRREIDILSALSSSRHPNICSFLDSFSYRDPTTGSKIFCMVTENCSRGDLQSYLKRVRKERKLKYKNNGALLLEGTFLSSKRHALSQVLCGLSFLHSRAIVHRDIKAPNIFLCPVQHDKSEPFSLLGCQLKIGDFGLAVQLKEDDDWGEALTTFCGTPSSLAPEVVGLLISTEDRSSAAASSTAYDSLMGTDVTLFAEESNQESRSGYGQPADLWSTGCLLYTMIVGHSPFAVPNTHIRDTEDQKISRVTKIQQVIQRIMHVEWSVPANVKIEKPLEMLLYQLLNERARERGTAMSILNSHLFFRGNGIFEGNIARNGNWNGNEINTIHHRKNDIRVATDIEALGTLNSKQKADEKTTRPGHKQSNEWTINAERDVHDEVLLHPRHKFWRVGPPSMMQHASSSPLTQDIIKAKEELTLAMAAAAETSAELLKLREREQVASLNLLMIDGSISGDMRALHSILNG
ncbi:hypothetical protein ACHAWF_010234, partial [Thalassiosira exigua]